MTKLSSDLPKAPGHLSREAKSWWRELQSEYVIDDSEGRFLLQSALESFDLMRRAEKEISESGALMQTDRYGQIRNHPASIVARDSRNQMLNALKALKLDGEENQSKPKGVIGRPTEASRRNKAKRTS